MGNSDQSMHPKIKVIGIGGCGANVLTSLRQKNHIEIKYILASTDQKTLDHTDSDEKILLGIKTTAGRGAGADPKIGEAACIESREDIIATLRELDLLIIATGLGGGTGSFGSCIVASIAKEMGILCVCFATLPFSMEGKKRAKIANEALERLKLKASCVIAVSNNRLISTMAPETKLTDALEACNSILHLVVGGLLDTLSHAGLINLDFADIKLALSQPGEAIIGAAEATGTYRIQEAITSAISNPLIKTDSLENAKAMLINITTGSDFDMQQLQTAGEFVKSKIAEDAHVLLGVVIQPSYINKVHVTIIATGLD